MALSDQQTTLSVRMTPSAAKAALKALQFAEARIAPPEYPGGPEDVRAWEAQQWLAWLGGRIRLASDEERQP